MHPFKWLTVLMSVTVILYGMCKYPCESPQYMLITISGFISLFDVAKRNRIQNGG